MSPAFDVVHACNLDGLWTGRHQMSINGKQDDFELADAVGLAAVAGVKRLKAAEMIENVQRAVNQWPSHAEAAGVEANRAAQIRKMFRRL